MITDADFKFIKYMNVESRRFSFWITFKDLRSSQRQHGKKARKELIKFWTQILGTLGEKWEYSVYSNSFVIKVNNSHDITLMLLKYHR